MHNPFPFFFFFFFFNSGAIAVTAKPVALTAKSVVLCVIDLTCHDDVIIVIFTSRSCQCHVSFRTGQWYLDLTCPEDGAGTLPTGQPVPWAAVCAGCKKRPSFAMPYFMLKIILLPRQARDKHRETLKKRCVFRRWVGPSGAAQIFFDDHRSLPAKYELAAKLGTCEHGGSPRSQVPSAKNEKRKR
jgi:hypothetical protein